MRANLTRVRINYIFMEQVLKFILSFDALPFDVLKIRFSRFVVVVRYDGDRRISDMTINKL